jgi:hypothetical protein
MSAIYVRKTANPKLAWPQARRDAWSKRIRLEQANGTWNKKSKKAVGKAISNGKKASSKRKRLSIARKNGWETRRANCDVDKVNPPKVSTSTEQDLIKMLKLLTKYLGFEQTIEEFTEQAVKEKMYRVAAVFNPNKHFLLFGDLEKER